MMVSAVALKTACTVQRRLMWPQKCSVPLDAVSVLAHDHHSVLDIGGLLGFISPLPGPPVCRATDLPYIKVDSLLFLFIKFTF